MKQLFSVRLSVALISQWLVLSVLLCCAFVQAAHAQDIEAALSEHYPAGSISSVKQSTIAQDEAREARKLVEKDFADAKHACFETFFASRCLKQAKERRRIHMEPIRRIEVEAAAFLRKEKAEERDRGVAERERKAKQPRNAPDLSISGASREPAPDQSDAEKK